MVVFEEVSGAEVADDFVVLLYGEVVVWAVAQYICYLCGCHGVVDGNYFIAWGHDFVDVAFVEVENVFMQLPFILFECALPVGEAKQAFEIGFGQFLVFGITDAKDAEEEVGAPG